MEQTQLHCAQYIKGIGRGKDNPSDLSHADARLVWGALLDGRISELEVGAILIALRIKGESVDEIAGFLDATEARGTRLAPPLPGAVPVVIPSYNGARNIPNLTPLLALLLAREGVPVLVHGKVGEAASASSTRRSAHDFDAPAFVKAMPPRVTSAEIFEALGLPAASNPNDVLLRLARGEPAFVSIGVLNAPLARVLALRRVLGVRSPAHTLVKLLQPFEEPALRLASFTHPEYHDTLSALFLRHPQGGDVLLSRGTEGEPVANARRAAAIEWFTNGAVTIVIAGQSSAGTATSLPESRDAATTARWIQAVLSGERPVPDAIAAQRDAILAARATMMQRVAKTAHQGEVD